MDKVLDLIREERAKQDAVWGESHDPGNSVMLAVLTEEVGEVAKALIDRWPMPCDVAELRAELVQVAAVAVRWLEVLGGRVSAVSEE